MSRALFTRKKGPTSKRLTTHKRKRNGIFSRRKNQFPQTPDGMNNITTPNVHDIVHKQPEPDDEEEEDNKENEGLSQEEQMQKEIGVSYNYISYIGAGAFGKVVKVTKKDKVQHKNIKSDEKQAEETFYAIKIVGNIFSSVAKTKRFLRELRILRLLSSHENIVELIDLVPPPNPLKFTTLSIVFEYVPTDIKKILKSRQYFSSLHIQYILYQILLALKFVHTAGIVHRDIKPENILINEACTIRLCDFGLARGVEENLEMKQKDIQSASAQILNMDLKVKEAAVDTTKKLKVQNALTKHVVTRWYRAPEVILLQQDRDTLYGIDVWSVGCIFAELLQMHSANCADYKQRKVMFPGKSCFPFSTKDQFDYQHRSDQLRVVFDLIGTPQQDEIERFSDKNVQIYLSNMAKSDAQDLQKRFPATHKAGIKLLSDMLQFDVRKRISMQEALKSAYFNDVRDEIAEQRHLKIEKFEFEDIDIDEMTLRALILDEIMYFNPKWKKQLKQEYKQKAKKLKELHEKGK